ncbi:MAG: triacylglycerol lipase [Solirubrobacterales bacterium]|nr:triacylglycerol lipase [Solirubrobacterales bacterium]
MKRLVLALSLVVLAAAPAAASAHDPIVFVHGWNSSGSVWNTMVSNFKADGWTSAELNSWSYNTGQSNATTAAQLRDKVDSVLAATGASKVDIISHSMGGLSSRYYTKNLGGDAKVDQWVSLGGPNHGTDTANLCGQTSCVEMRVGSSFLTALNSGDETPGAPAYATWWSPCDSVINPDSSVALSGARNTKTACLGHSALTTDRTVYGQVRDFVAP